MRPADTQVKSITQCDGDSMADEIGLAELVQLPMLSAAAFALTTGALHSGALSLDVDSLEPIWEAVHSGRPALAAALLLVWAAAAIRRYGGAKFPALNSETGSAATVLLGSFGAAAASALTGGAEPSWALCWRALVIAIGASGGYSLAKQLLVDPILRPLSRRAPAWLRPVFSVIFWPFDHSRARLPDIQGAIKAGEAAVAKVPPPGVAGATGEPRDVE